MANDQAREKQDFAGYSGYTILTSVTGGWLAGACSLFRATYVKYLKLF